MEGEVEGGGSGGKWGEGARLPSRCGSVPGQRECDLRLLLPGQETPRKRDVVSRHHESELPGGREPPGRPFGDGRNDPRGRRGGRRGQPRAPLTPHAIFCRIRKYIYICSRVSNIYICIHIYIDIHVYIHIHICIYIHLRGHGCTTLMAARRDTGLWVHRGFTGRADLDRGRPGPGGLPPPRVPPPLLLPPCLPTSSDAP